MTSIEQASQCSVRRPLSEPSGVVTVEQVFPGWPTVGFSDPSETVPGADTGDPARCPGELPSDPLCDQPLPWAGLLGDGFLAASGARRIVDGYLLSMPKGAASDAPPENTPGARMVTYRLLDLAPDDPKAVGAYLDRAFRVCAEARTSSGPSSMGRAGRRVSSSASCRPSPRTCSEHALTGWWDRLPAPRHTWQDRWRIVNPLIRQQE
jgi:hypothetical protein